MSGSEYPKQVCCKWCGRAFWLFADGPSLCTECGQKTVMTRRKNKNRSQEAAGQMALFGANNAANSE